MDIPIFYSSPKFFIQDYTPHTLGEQESAQAQELGEICAQMIKTALKSKKILFSSKADKAFKSLNSKIILALSSKNISQQTPIHQQVITCCLNNFADKEFHNKKNPISRKQVELLFYIQAISETAYFERPHYDNTLDRMHGVVAYDNPHGIGKENPIYGSLSMEDSPVNSPVKEKNSPGQHGAVSMEDSPVKEKNSPGQAKAKRSLSVASPGRKCSLTTGRISNSFGRALSYEVNQWQPAEYDMLGAPDVHERVAPEEVKPKQRPQKVYPENPSDVGYLALINQGDMEQFDKPVFVPDSNRLIGSALFCDEDFFNV